MRQPAKLSARWGRVWRSGKAELVGRGQWDAVSAAVLDRLVLNLVEAENGLAQAASEPFTEGSMGQLVSHPGFGVARGCEASALAAARQLCLTPATRGSGRGDQDEEKPDDGSPAAAIDELAKVRAKRAV